MSKSSFTHELKCHPVYFQAIRDGRKKFELRIEDDKTFMVGETLLLREYDPLSKHYSGDTEAVEVTYLMRGAGTGLENSYACMSIQRPTTSPSPSVEQSEQEWEKIANKIAVEAMNDSEVDARISGLGALQGHILSAIRLSHQKGTK